MVECYLLEIACCSAQRALVRSIMSINTSSAPPDSEFKLGGRALHPSISLEQMRTASFRTSSIFSNGDLSVFGLALSHRTGCRSSLMGWHQIGFKCLGAVCLVSFAMDCSYRCQTTVCGTPLGPSFACVLWPCPAALDCCIHVYHAVLAPAEGIRWRLQLIIK